MNIFRPPPFRPHKISGPPLFFFFFCHENYGSTPYRKACKLNFYWEIWGIFYQKSKVNSFTYLTNNWHFNQNYWKIIHIWLRIQTIVICSWITRNFNYKVIINTNRKRKLLNMLKTFFWPKYALFHPNLRLASFEFGFRRSKITWNDKIFSDTPKPRGGCMEFY